MSSCFLVEFRNGIAQEDAIRFGNSAGGVMRICNAMYERYLRDRTDPYDHYLKRFAQDKCQPTYDLAQRQDIEPFERMALLFAADNAIVRRENFGKLAVHLRQFEERHPIPANYANHLLAWAEVLENSDADAIGVWATSVMRNPWFLEPGTWDHTDAVEAGEPAAYNLYTGDSHFEIYARAENIISEFEFPPAPVALDGLYQKYIVIRTDGSSALGGKHRGCQYFVLDIDHDPHALPALAAYIKSCAATHPVLADDLSKIVAQKMRESSPAPGSSLLGTPRDFTQFPE